VSAPGAAATLGRLGATALYTPGGGEAWAFLLWDASGAHPSLPLADTWADQGVPARPGWYVFLPAVPLEADAPALEAALRGALDPPAATGWAWSARAARGNGAALRAAVPVHPDGEGRPVVAKDVPVTLPAGLLAFGFAAGLRVAATRDAAGEIDGLVAARPDPDAQPWTGIRVLLAGPFAGCIRFAALRESKVSGDRSVKEAAEVSLDPLRPFDQRRTWIGPTGAEYLLVAEGGGAYRIERHPSA
jgi:hypothetical protein